MGSFVIDLECWTFANTERLLQHFDDVYALAREDPRHSLSLSLPELERLHRLCVAQSLAEGSGLDEIRRRVTQRHLSRLLHWRALSIVESLHADILGAMRELDFGTALVLCQKIVGHAFDSLLGALGNTNPLEKWRFRKLASIPADFGQFFGVRQFLANPAQLFLQSFSLCASFNVECNVLIRNTIDIVNRVIAVAQKSVQDDSVLLSAIHEERNPSTIRATDTVSTVVGRLPKIDDSFHRRLKTSIQFRWHNGSIWLFDLSGHYSIRLNDYAFVALCANCTSNHPQISWDCLSLGGEIPTPSSTMEDLEKSFSWLGLLEECDL
jgi:hypothetical protein